ncbi:hypothetical protein EGW08_018740 [Elysia chlorotica]|uniref:Uncharacterized protein n=1 Tax=Elysia chlorotica TaxID=188477 RepID=A0A433SW35_ELYCH|nr:hypothetical protein EGW08_018740 [Elysia chlorotica]
MTSTKKLISSLTKMQDEKENKPVDKDQSKIYQTKPKTESKIRPPEVLDFSLDSDDGIENRSLSHSQYMYSKSPLKEQNIQPYTSFLRQEVNAEVLCKYSSRNESFEMSPTVTATKSETNNFKLEWDDVLNTPPNFRSPTASGKKRLLSSKAVDSDMCFHSTPKESKDRSKQMSLILRKKLSQSQSLKSSDTESNLDIPSDQDSLKSLDKHIVLCNQDYFVEVQDSSAQTSFQLEGLHGKLLQSPADEKCNSSEYNLFSEENTVQTFVKNQKEENENIHCHKSFNQSFQCEESSSEISTTEECSGSKLSQISHHTHDSFVDVRDTSVQVELLHSGDQDEVSKMPNHKGVLSISGANLENANLEEENDPSLKHLSFKMPNLKEHTTQEGNKSNSVEDSNNSTSSNSMLYVSALEAVSNGHEISLDSQTSDAFSSNEDKHSINTNCTGEVNCDPSSEKKEVSSVSVLCETSVNNKAESSIFVANTDSDSDTEERACAQPFYRVEASFSESSVCEDVGLAEEKEGNLSIKDNNLINKSVSSEAKGYEEKDEDEKKEKMAAGNFLETGFVETNGSNVSEKRAGENKGLLKSTISRRAKDSDSSDEDDAFEKFLTKMKDTKQTKQEDKMDRSMSDFIADDDEELTDYSFSDSSISENEMFHVKPDNDLDRKRRPRKKSSSFFEESESGESDKDVKSKHVLQLSSDDENLLDDFITKGNTPCGLPKKIDSVNSMDNKILNTPQARGNAEAHPNDFKTPFKTPRRPIKISKAWERPFGTPTADHRRKPLTEPSDFRDKKSCPMTISKLHHLKRQSNIGLDDEAVFLKSLSEDYHDYKRHPEALRFVKHFKEKKAELTQRLFSIFNKFVFKRK